MWFKLAALSVLCLIVLAVSPAQSSFDSPREWFESFCDKLLYREDQAAEFVIDSIFSRFPEAESDAEGQMLAIMGSLGQARLKFGGAPVSCNYGYRRELGSNLVGLVYVLNYPAEPVILLGHFRMWEDEWHIYAFDLVAEASNYPYVPQ